MMEFYDYQKIADLQRQGGCVAKSGKHAVWVWARAGCQARVALGDVTLEATHRASGPVDDGKERFSWERAGEVELRRGERFALRLESLQSGLPEKDRANVGFLALSTDRGFDPRRGFEVSRVLGDRAVGVGDARLAETRGVSTPWTLRTYPTLEGWQERAAHIRQRILACMGLWPLPEKRDLNPRVFDGIERDGYSVAKVFFESLPGYFVCGNLYRPAGEGPFPGIACPHGHWSNGRLEDSELGSIPGRCINLARQGHVAFSYDMVGYVDSGQVDHGNIGGRREDLWGIGAMGLQLWNSIRVLDFLEAREEVDSQRLGCTGASGGGTQTFMLTAVDERVKAAAPVNMVSAHMQGGCNCENQAHLRLEINNIEIAACAAPRPLFLVSATGDWTVDTPELEYSAIREIYRLYGAQDQVGCTQVDAPHNFNRESREAVYAFFGRTFLGEKDRRKLAEKPFQVEKSEDLRVFTGREMPKGALNQDGVVQALVDRSEKRLEGLRPKDARGLRRLRETLGGALQQALGVETVDSGNLFVRRMGRTRRESFIIERLILGRKEQGERIPALLLLPRPLPARFPAVLVIHPEGKGALADVRRGRPGGLVSGLLDRGNAVLAIDPFLVGEFHGPFQSEARDESESHFHTYNQAVAACRVQDALTGVAFLNSLTSVSSCHLLGLNRGGIYCLLARACGAEVGRTTVDFDRLAADADETWVEEELFVPGIRSAGDVRTALALCAPGELLVHNGGRSMPVDWATAGYRAAGKEEKLVISRKRMREGEVMEWVAG